MKATAPIKTQTVTSGNPTIISYYCDVLTYNMLGLFTGKNQMMRGNYYGGKPNQYLLIR